MHADAAPEEIDVGDAQRRRLTPAQAAGAQQQDQAAVPPAFGRQHVQL